MNKNLILFFIGLFIALVGNSVRADIGAEEYIIGPEDELEISFWQDPVLNTTVRVANDGRIVIPVIGSITAAGLKPSQLSRKIVDKISIFNKNITQASVVVIRYGSNKLYITGQVRQPGKRTFEQIPNLWDAILEAGGPTENASLNHVTIIRGGFEKGKKIVVDLPRYLNNGDMGKLPPLYKGDTVFIPALPNRNNSVQSASPLAQQNMIYVYGSVRNPGNFMITSDLTLIQALELAGGITESADLSKVRILSSTRGTPVITVIDLNDNVKVASTKPPKLKPNDTIIVPARRFSGAPSFWNQLLIEVITTGASVAVTIFLSSMF